jgi:hypothetical protein
LARYLEGVIEFIVRKPVDSIELDDLDEHSGVLVPPPKVAEPAHRLREAPFSEGLIRSLSLGLLFRRERCSSAWRAGSIRNSVGSRTPAAARPAGGRRRAERVLDRSRAQLERAQADGWIETVLENVVGSARHAAKAVRHVGANLYAAEFGVWLCRSERSTG